MRIKSLTTRFVLTLLLSTAVPFLVFAWFVRGELRERQVQIVESLLEAEAETLRTRIVNQLEAFQRECSVFRGLAVAELLGAAKPQEFRDEVEFSPGFDGEYQLVVLADATGKVREVVAVERDLATATTRRPLLPTEVSDAPWFRQLLASTSSEVTDHLWLDRHLSPYFHHETDKSSRDPADYSYGLAVTVYGEGRELGIVLALKSWSALQGEVDARAEILGARFSSAQVFLNAEDGVALSHSDRELAGERVLDPESILQTESAVTLPHIDSSGVLRHAAQSEVGAGFAPLTWRVGLDVSDAQLFAVSERFGDLLLLVTIVVAAILVVWAAVASRAILRPVRQLAAATERVAAGDFEARVPDAAGDELGDLARAFNAMAEEVAASRDRMRDFDRQTAWAEMARQVAHEIKNPLTPMRMSAQLLLRARRAEDPRLPELVDRLARTVTEQTDALARIASDFRQFAGQPERKLERITVKELLGDVEQDFAATISSGFALTIDAGDAAAVLVEVDRHEVRRVFLNLVQNALEATSVSGAIQLVASTQAEGAAVGFSVIDDGGGVDESAREHLFEPYFTTRSSGTGLGLAICRRMIEGHGGSIALVDSRPGRTEFRFDLPVA